MTLRLPKNKRDAKIVRDATEFRRGLIGDQNGAGWCAVVSWSLAGFLGFAHGIQTGNAEREIEIGDGSTLVHVWVTMPDGRVLDPTMDQFGTEWPKVYLGEPVKGIHLP